MNKQEKFLEEIVHTITKVLPCPKPDKNAKLTFVGNCNAITGKRRIWRDGEPIHVIKPVRYAIKQALKRK